MRSKNLQGCKEILVFIVWVLSLSTFYFIATKIKAHGPILFDQHVMNIVRLFESPQLTKWMTMITELGSRRMITLFVVMAVLYLLVVHRDYLAMFMLSFAFFSGIKINHLFKNLYDRIRPEINDGIDAVGYAFPSGHAIYATIFYGFIIYFILKSHRSPRFKLVFSTLLALLILLIGFSRIYLHAHYATDVIGGFAIGFVWLYICIVILRVLQAHRLLKD